MKDVKNDKIKKYFNDNFLFFRYLWAGSYDLAMHIGFWDKKTINRKEALINENKFIAKLLDADKKDKILDLGCGMGGTSIWFAENYGSNVTGVDFVEKNIQMANKMSKKRGVNDLVKFLNDDFNKINFLKSSFNKIYSIEGFSYSINKNLFIKNCYKSIKNNGTIVIADYFSSPKLSLDEAALLNKWCRTWSYPNLLSKNDLMTNLKDNGFTNIKFYNKTNAIMRSSKSLNKISLKTYPFLNLLYKLRISKELPDIEAIKNEERLFNDGIILYGVVIAEKNV